MVPGSVGAGLAAAAGWRPEIGREFLAASFLKKHDSFFVRPEK
jgi:hypothetical protein